MDTETLDKLQDIFRRLTALERLVHSELKEELVEMDARIDTLSDVIERIDTRIHRLTDSVSNVSLMTGGVERSLDRLTTFLAGHADNMSVRRLEDDVRHAQLVGQLEALSRKIDDTAKTSKE